MLRIFVIGLFCLAAAPLSARDFSGRMVFVDADTATVGGIKVRLFGIDAPELDQSCKRDNGRDWACGKWATRQARRLFGGKQASCTPRAQDRYGRTVARCMVDGVDVAAELVRRGIAEAYRAYSQDYVAMEKQAVVERIGIWAGSMVSPSEYRAAKRAAQAAAAAPAGDCVIKGNISTNGRIYHLPGQENYDITRIDTRRGERWFCTEAEARAAGWRRARR